MSKGISLLELQKALYNSHKPIIRDKIKIIRCPNLIKGFGMEKELKEKGFKIMSRKEYNKEYPVQSPVSLLTQLMEIKQ